MLFSISLLYIPHVSPHPSLSLLMNHLLLSINLTLFILFIFIGDSNSFLKKHYLLPMEMARNCAKDRWEHSNLAQEVSEEDEDLSFCDLPVINCSTKEDHDQSRKDQDALAIQNQEDLDQFDFSSRGGSLLKESKMCAADEVFFQGRILPLRLSVSSDTGLPRFQHDQTQKCISRSESMDHRSTGGFGFASNNSSRSSSTRSYNSSSSNSSSSSIRRTNYKPKFQNTFLTCPTPKPQIKVSTTQQGSVGIRIRNSSTWDYLRLGLLPTPEIGLQDLKIRRNSSVNKNSVSRNSSQGSSSNSVVITRNISAKINSGCYASNTEKQRTPGFLEKGIGGLLNGCKCLDETVSSNAVIIKSSSNGNNNSESALTHAKKEKLLAELKMKKKKDEKQQLQGKQAMSRHRTSEWLKELPHAVYPPEGQTH